MHLDPPVSRQGQVEVEVVYRNDSFVRYTAAQGSIPKPGLAKLFARNCRRGRTREAPPPDESRVSSIRPTPMFKVAWIDQETMLGLGYVTDQDKDAATRLQNRTALYHPENSGFIR